MSKKIFVFLLLEISCLLFTSCANKTPDTEEITTTETIEEIKNNDSLSIYIQGNDYIVTGELNEGWKQDGNIEQYKNVLASYSNDDARITVTVIPGEYSLAAIKEDIPAGAEISTVENNEEAITIVYTENMAKTKVTVTETENYSLYIAYTAPEASFTAKKKSAENFISTFSLLES